MPSRAKTVDGASFPALSSDPAENIRNRSLIEIVALAGLSILGMLALLPSTDEKTAALIADQRYPQAISMLESRARSLPLNNYEAFSLARLYHHVGDDAKALPILEQMLKTEAGSASVLRELADIYSAESRPKDELGILLQLFKSAPDTATNNRLIELYRQQGDAAGEEAQLAAAERVGLVQKPLPPAEIVPAVLSDNPRQAI